MPWPSVNQSRGGPSGQPTASLSLLVQVGAMPGCPGASLRGVATSGIVSALRQLRGRPAAPLVAGREPSAPYSFPVLLLRAGLGAVLPACELPDWAGSQFMAVEFPVPLLALLLPLTASQL